MPSRSRRCPLKFVTLIFFVFCAIIWFTWRNSIYSNNFLASLPYNTDLELDDVYVVLSSDLNFYYLLHVPVAIQHWKNLGVKTLLLIILKPDDKVDKAARNVINYCTTLGAHIAYLRSSELDIAQYAAASRLYAAGLEFAHSLNPNKTVFITSDVDFLPLEVANHVPKRLCHKEIMLYDYNCCEPFDYNGVTVRYLTMNTVAMTLRRWREVMDLPSKPVGEGIVETQFDAVFHGGDTRDELLNWRRSNRLLSIKYNNWKARNIKTFNYIVSIYDHKGTSVLHRYNWPSPEELAQMKISTWESLHVAPQIYITSVWRANKPIYEKLFTTDQLTRLATLRRTVLPLINITETKQRANHPDRKYAFWHELFGIPIE